MSKQFRDTFVSVFRLDVVARLCPTRTFYTRPLNPYIRFCFAYPCARHTDHATRDMCCICAYTYMDILYTLQVISDSDLTRQSVALAAIRHLGLSKLKILTAEAFERSIMYHVLNFKKSGQTFGEISRVLATSSRAFVQAAAAAASRPRASRTAGPPSPCRPRSSAAGISTSSSLRLEHNVPHRRKLLLLFRECCSRCRFQPYDCVVIRFVE